jgi:uncharacterized protein involved in cysteine biosynthesis
MAASAAGALAVLVVLGGVVWWVTAGSGWLHPDRLASHPWVPWVSGSLGLIVFVVAAWLLFPVVVTAVAGLFLEALADRIERRHYPGLPKPREVPLGEQLLASARGLLRGLGWNLLALPLYVIPGVNLIAYAFVNARLLSREYFQVVALRHLPAVATGELYRRHHWQLVRGGLLLTGLFVLPGVQLIAPLLATAWAVHRLWRRDDAVLRVALLGRKE